MSFILTLKDHPEGVFSVVDREPGTHVIHIFENADEVASVQDNRLGGLAYGSVLFSHWIIMIRKIGLTIVWAGQNEELDRRIKLQTDLVGYATVSRKKKGKEVGVSWVYQNNVYSSW